MNWKYLFLFLAFFSLHIIAQNKWYHYDWTHEDRSSDPALCEQIYKFDLKKYKNSRFVGTYYKEFSEEYITYLAEDLAKGNIYRSFENKEAYIMKVLKTIVKDTALTNPIRIFFYRNEDVNASMSESGILRVYIGLIARLNNEAELAMTLGHELGHFMSDDAARSTAREREHPNQDIEWKASGLGWGWGGLGVKFVGIKNQWYSREQEEGADMESMRFLKQSPYSMKSAANLYRIFKRDEIRWEIKYGKRVAAGRSHPDPGDRLKIVKGFAQDNIGAGKNFVVDSIEFMKLKQLCYMETVNLDLQTNNLDDLFTLTFSRYLVAPEDEYNLAVLIEGLRRYILLTESTKAYKGSFILNQYQTNRPELAEHYAFLKEKNPSILNYLSKGFVDIWKEDLKNIKAKDLKDSTVTEFTTYLEAYDYFKKKANEMNSKIAEHYQYFGPNPKLENLESYQPINTIFGSNNYLSAKKSPPAPKSAVIIIPFDPAELSTLFDVEHRRTGTKQFNQDLEGQLTGLRKQQVSDLLSFEQLSCRHRQLAYAMADLCLNRLKIDMSATLNYNYKENWAESSPELYDLLAENKLSELYLCIPYRPLDAKNVFKLNRIGMYYYKISLPGSNKISLVGTQRDWDVKDLKNRENFFKDVNKELNNFCK